MDDETKKHIEELHTMMGQLALEVKGAIPNKEVILQRYYTIIKDYESNLNESLSLEFKEKGISETLTAIESLEAVNIFNEKDPETNKSKYSNETLRKTELISRLKKNPDYVKNKQELKDIEYRKKNLANSQITNKMWLKYYELRII